MGVSTNYSAWFGGGTNASAAVLTPAQVAAIAPLVRVTAAYVVMYYAFCFFQSWSKLYLSASRRPSLFFSSTRAPAPRPWRGSLMRLLPSAGVAAMACRVRHREIGTDTPPIRHRCEIRHRRDSRPPSHRRRTAPPNADGKRPTLMQLKYGNYGSSKTRTLRLLGDRTFLNTLEQAPPFLVSLWACGLLADVELAAFCGKCYIFFRCLYPIVFRKGMPYLLLSTVPCYNIIWYMLFRAVVACA